MSLNLSDLNLSDIWLHFKAWIISESKEILDFLQPFAASLEQQGGLILITAAQNAVKAGFNTPGDGMDKMTAALASFSAEVADKGLPYLEGQARALIEVALQNAKGAISESSAS